MLCSSISELIYTFPSIIYLQFKLCVLFDKKIYSITFLSLRFYLKYRCLPEALFSTVRKKVFSRERFGKCRRLSVAFPTSLSATSHAIHPRSFSYICSTVSYSDILTPYPIFYLFFFVVMNVRSIATQEIITRRVC